MDSKVASAVAPVVAATEAYERWLHKHVVVVESDLELKHQYMKDSLFAFLRATFYRWAALWQETFPDLADAPRLVAVGDLHVENFGTWRDTEGRLIWGVNDFDEVARMPYAIDLVRLVTSAMFAKRENGLSIDDGAAATAVLEGYSGTLASGGKPFVLEESHPDLRAMALGAERDPVKFWGKLVSLAGAQPPKRVQRLLTAWLPDRAMWESPNAMAAWPHARRSRGCLQPGVGPWAARRTMPLPCACSSARCASAIPSTSSRTGG
jgi:hypothetical protein